MVGKGRVHKLALALFFMDYTRFLDWGLTRGVLECSKSLPSHPPRQGSSLRSPVPCSFLAYAPPPPPVAIFYAPIPRGGGQIARVKGKDGRPVHQFHCVYA